MYLRKIQISNIRTLKDLEWEVPKGQEAGWHVIIGDNGSGKSTFLRAIALALVGPVEAHALREDWNDWLTRKEESGHIRLEIIPNNKLDLFSEPDKTPDSYSQSAVVMSKGDDEEHPLRIFLSYSNEDQPIVADLYEKLQVAGFAPWMALYDLLPGQRWESATRKAISDADFFLACLSNNTAARTGFTHQEINAALDVWNTKLDSDIYLIPVRLEECEVPKELGVFRWVDIFKKDGWGALERSLRIGQKRLRSSVRVVGASDNDLLVQLNFLRQGNDVNLLKPEFNLSPDQHVWGGKSGWFSASYGPFRRFSGGDKEYEKLFYSNPKLSSHLSVFGENIALTECIRWLQELQFRKLEKQAEGALLDRIVEFVNQEGFLPHAAQLHSISSKGVVFIDGNGVELQLEELSDGYRSVLSMTFELIRQLARTYGPRQVFDSNAKKIKAPGVVLIDEIDAHLHPSWQRRIGLWFREHFPNLQFIVTTHSPLVCQAADKGSVWRLPRPGVEENGKMVTGTELDRLLFGNVLDAYGTELFGDNISRSEESKRLLQKLAVLNRKELLGQLSSSEQKEQQKLRAILPTAAHTLDKKVLDEK